MGLTIHREKDNFGRRGDEVDLYNRYPKISIVTPSYNQGQFLEQTIISVVSQKYPNLDYIVIDGGSDDDTIDILRRYENDLIWISEPDRGQSHAINKGLGLASGEIVGFLNSDDLLEPRALWLVGEHFLKCPESTWVFGKCRVIDLDGREVRKGITAYKNLWLHLNAPLVLYILNFISQPATFWRQELMHSCGCFDEALNYALDYDYWLRLARLFEPAVMNTYLACFRMHPNSKSGRANCAQFAEQLMVAKRYTDSQPLLRIHAIHNYLSRWIYKYMQEPRTFIPRRSFWRGLSEFWEEGRFFVQTEE